ncbi:MAG: hypothetical protein VZR24_05840 [Butyrivibrio hungatei]|nr:hypothetical protein [Butyrivibrio hungatei]
MKGIYNYSRNPAFLGFDLVYIGILLMFFNPVLLVISVFAMVMLHLYLLCAYYLISSVLFYKKKLRTVRMSLIHPRIQ